MSDLVKRLRDFTKSEIVRIDAAERIEALEAALRQAREAFELHGQQYPHMQKGYTLDALSAIYDVMNDTPEKQK
jgi:hypothetical protein